MAEDLAFTFLCEAVPWMERVQVERGLRLCQDGFEEGSPPFLLIEALCGRLDGWTADPDKLPEPLTTKPLPKIIAPGPDGKDPWVEQSLGWWKMAGVTGDDMAVSQALLSYCLLPFQQGNGLSPDQALAFFSQAC